MVSLSGKPFFRAKASALKRRFVSGSPFVRPSTYAVDLLSFDDRYTGYVDVSIIFFYYWLSLLGSPFSSITLPSWWQQVRFPGLDIFRVENVATSLMIAYT